MKRLLLLITCLLMLSIPDVSAQCTGGTSAGSITPTTSWQSVTGLTGKPYYSFAAIAGYRYYFSFCPADGGNSTKDTELSINTSTGIMVAGAYNDDFCGLQSYLGWLCPTSGNYRILITKSVCQSSVGLGTLVYRCTPPLSCPGNLGTGVTNVSSLPYASGAGTTCGTVDDLNSSNTMACGNTSYLGGEDAVWIFTPAVTGAVDIDLTSTGTYTSLMLYQGCPLLGQGGTCLQVDQSSTGNKSLTVCVTAGVTYYLILDSWPSPTCNAYNNLTISAPVAAGGCALGTGVNNITIPYSATGRTTCGKGNDLTNASLLSCGNSLYTTGEDEVYVFTPSTSGNITISITSAGSYTGMMLYAGCPTANYCTGTASTCIATEQSSSGSKLMCTNVTAGVTYYLVIDSWSTPYCNPYNISISAPAATQTGASCANAVTIASMPYTAVNENTQCMGNDYTSASVGSCGTLYESGEDRVYKYVATGAECLSITLSGTSSNFIGYQVYLGCPGTAGTTCIGNGSGANSGTLSGSVNLPSAGTYYIVVDSWAPPANVSYNISIISFGSGAVNDLPCNAVAVPLGVYVTSSNNCSGSASEPAAPACWITPNTRNTVWFSAVAPASGQLRFKVIPISLTNPQVAMYSGSCGALTYMACNDDATACGTTANLACDLPVSGLTPGATYYFVVDGVNDLTGSFGVIAMDATQPVPALSNGQDCGTYLPVCDTTMSFGDPGFQVFGNICDFPGGGSNCLLTGERGSVWFDIPIIANGNLQFTIIPKDWPGAPSTSGTDYDFAVWKIQGAGATTCAGIAGGATPVSCNYSYLGVTGCNSSTANVPPPAYPGFDAAFNQQIAVLAGEEYVLVVSNWANSTSGFDIMMNSTSPINYTFTSTRATWSGGADTDWYRKENWGGCAIPDCGHDAYINGGIVLQPAITTGGAVCKSMIINPGATLTLGTGVSLSVCENFINYGSLSANSNSTVQFTSPTALHQIDGSLTGSNAFGKMMVNKAGGSVSMLQNIDVKSDFTVSGASSVFNAAGNKLSVGGNFSNTGVFNPGSGILAFNGSGAQSYYNNETLNSVLMNHNGSGVTLLTDMLTGSAGILTLSSGKIITGAKMVSVANRSSVAVSVGNATSYVEGNLRRYINSTGSYDFPVGHALKGYQRANINYAYPASPTINDNLSVNFQPYAALPAPLGASACGFTFSKPALNNGYWNFTASNSATSGNFDLTLYNSNYTNADFAWTVMQGNGTAWALGSGNCAASVASAVKRTNMNGLMSFGSAQAPDPLPVTLLSLKATGNDKGIDVRWVTASEFNNSGFEIQRTDNPEKDFEVIGWQDGAGNSSAVLHYSYFDRDVIAGKRYYYRLRQVDHNGDNVLTDVVSAVMDSDVLNAWIYPNPVDNSTALSIDMPEEGFVTVVVTSASGVRLYSGISLNVPSGVNSFPLNRIIHGFSSGLYSVQVNTANQSAVLKVLIP